MPTSRTERERRTGKVHQTLRPPISRLLIAETILTFMPTLAAIVGLNEAIFLQQIQYWCATSDHIADGQVWVYNTIDQWQEQFPFWSAATIFRIVKSLRESGVLLTSSAYNKHATDRTLWYAIDHDALDRLLDFALSQSPSYQSDEIENSAAVDASYQSDKMLKGTETTTENNQEKGTSAEFMKRAMPADEWVKRMKGRKQY